jgi:hypothetical protein
MINLLTERGSYWWLEGILGLGIGGSVLGVYSWGWVLLRRDKGQLLTPEDRRLYAIAFIQTVILVIHWGVLRITFFEYPSRVLKLLLNIFIGTTIIYYRFGEDISPKIRKALSISVFAISALLIFMLFDADIRADCGDNFWELFDLLYILTTMFIIYVGTIAISEINILEHQNINTPSDPQVKILSLQLIRNQRTNYLLIIVGNGLACGLFVFSDLMKFYVGIPSGESCKCQDLFMDKSLFKRTLLVLTELLANLLPALTLFYIYVGKNWSLLDLDTKPETSLNEACESIRSQLILETELEDLKRLKEDKSKFELKITF